MNDLCFFATDLHGHISRYTALFQRIREGGPGIVLLGGDILPSWLNFNMDFIHDFLVPELRKLREDLGPDYPRILTILGNDDARVEEAALLQAGSEGLLDYMHMRELVIGDYTFYGYAMVPPTPFMLKDWEKYDVGVYVDPGCVHPTEGFRSVPADEDPRYTNIATDLNTLIKPGDLGKSIVLFHAPPYNTNLDRAALDGKMVEYVPLDVHVGSIAIQRFISERQPMLTLHGHIHESSSITGEWKEVTGRTISCSAAWDGPELALAEFHLSDPAGVQRFL